MYQLICHHFLSKRSAAKPLIAYFFRPAPRDPHESARAVAVCARASCQWQDHIPLRESKRLYPAYPYGRRSKRHRLSHRPFRLVQSPHARLVPAAKAPPPSMCPLGFAHMPSRSSLQENKPNCSIRNSHIRA